MIKQSITAIFALILALNLASAIMINSVNTPILTPGQEGVINIEVENVFNDDAEDVSLTLNFQNLPFIPIGTSEQTAEEIQKDDEENFVFRIKSSSDVTPKDYEIPYTLSYRLNSEQKTKTGTIGVKVTADPDLTFTINTENAVIDKTGQITFKIVNKGFADARFVSVKLIPNGYTLLSEDEVYIGTVSSDDFETAAFDVIFKKTNADFEAIVEYKNSDNSEATENVNLPLTVYSQEKALELGIIKPNLTPYYVGGVIGIIILYLIYRSIRKRRRIKRSIQEGSR
ncbi:hypothetical protein J4402_00210 [Candidatus Pacearchaeota archaeon]|nr:hypothetical protein [Candidatus Pacearchaeota archaeon]